MRLSVTEYEAIVAAIEYFRKGISGELRLYGSRTDDSKKGGDIDLLLIAEDEVGRAQLQTLKFDIISAIQTKLGERKIDLLITHQHAIHHEPFLKMIFPTSVNLKTWK